MNKIFMFLALLVLTGSLNAFIGEGESNVFTITVTPVDESVLPPDTQNTCLREAFPNPFRSGEDTRMGISVQAGETATLSIYNLKGQVVSSQTLSPGIHQIVWNGRDRGNDPCGSGIFLVSLKSPSHASTTKLVLLK